VHRSARVQQVSVPCPADMQITQNSFVGVDGSLATNANGIFSLWEYNSKTCECF